MMHFFPLPATCLPTRTLEVGVVEGVAGAQMHCVRQAGVRCWIWRLAGGRHRRQSLRTTPMRWRRRVSPPKRPTLLMRPHAPSASKRWGGLAAPAITCTPGLMPPWPAGGASAAHVAVLALLRALPPALHPDMVRLRPFTCARLDARLTAAFLVFARGRAGSAVRRSNVLVLTAEGGPEREAPLKADEWCW